jgi:hypothetical protein
MPTEYTLEHVRWNGQGRRPAFTALGTNRPFPLQCGSQEEPKSSFVALAPAGEANGGLEPARLSPQHSLVDEL